MPEDPSPAPSVPRGWRSRGYLPHFEGGEIPQAVTFRLADSLPASRLRELEEELRTLPPDHALSRLRGRIERYLDLGRGEAHLRRPEVAGIAQDALLFFDGERYRLYSWVVMPNHVHALLTALPDFTLSGILHSWKSFTAKQANRVLGRQGRFWQDEYHDRYIRGEKHFDRALAYIEGNPVEAGLCDREERWPYGSACLREQGRFEASTA